MLVTFKYSHKDPVSNNRPWVQKEETLEIPWLETVEDYQFNRFIDNDGGQALLYLINNSYCNIPDTLNLSDIQLDSVEIATT